MFNCSLKVCSVLSKVMKFRNNNGNIEILLLLCCVVGVVAFFCFTLCITNLLQQLTEASELHEELNALLSEKEHKEVAVNNLNDKKKRLEKKINKLKVKTGRNKLSESQRSRLEHDLKKLSEKRTRLSRKIGDLRKELAKLNKLSDAGKRQEKEEKLQRLKSESQALNENIEEKSKLLLQYNESKTIPYLVEKAERLRNELNKIRQEKNGLETEVNSLKTKTIWGGSSSFKSPLFVECSKNAYIFYPEGEAVALTEMNEKNIFQGMVTGRDIIVLLVRPNGYEAFDKAYARVKNMSIALSYEPIAAGKDLSFLEKKDEK